MILGVCSLRFARRGGNVEQMEKLIDILNKYGPIVLILLLVIIGLIFLIKHIIAKTIDVMLNVDSSKKIQSHINQLNRRTIAYELLLKKELLYYENILEFISVVVVSIQDVCWNYNEYGHARDKQEKNKYKNQSIENFQKILKLIPSTKKDNIIYENYTSSDISKIHSKLICYIQDNAEQIVKILGKKKYYARDFDTMNVISQDLLKICALLSTMIHQKHDELSK